MKLRFYPLFIGLLFCIVQTQAQPSTSTLPDWVAMIDNPSTNYHEAIKAFDAYWLGKIKPHEEMDLDEELTLQERGERESYFKGLSVAERSRFDLLQYHYKRFKQWKKEVKPYVQEDGRILSQQERIDIWNQQQTESKQQKK